MPTADYHAIPRVDSNEAQAPKQPLLRTKTSYHEAPRIPESSNMCTRVCACIKNCLVGFIRPWTMLCCESAGVPIEKASLQTGDVVLFAGRRCLSTCVQMGTCSEYSHSGFVIRGIDGDDVVYICHSTPNPGGNPDVEGVVRRGVMLNPLEDEMNSGFYSAVSVRKLLIPVNEEEEQKVRDNYQEWKGTPYSGTGRVCNAALDCEDVCECCTCCMNTESVKQQSAFCSELVTQMLQHIKRIPTEDIHGNPLYASEESPGDISEWQRNALHPIQRISLPKDTRLSCCRAFCNFAS